MRRIKNRKAVSPVIATVVLVAVAITVSVAVAYWMGGIAGQYTKFEKVEIQNAVCTNNGTFWTITMKLKNTGTAGSTLISVFINEVEVDNYDSTSPVANAWATNINTTVNTVIRSGQTLTVYFWMDSAKTGSTLTSGTTINIKIHSSGGMDYIKLVELV
jgi:flagellin-like protein